MNEPTSPAPTDSESRNPSDATHTALAPPSPPTRNIQLNDNTWSMLTHLSALSGLVVPFGNIIGPLVFWILKKDTSPAVDFHGKESLNCQLTGLIAITVLGATAFVLTFVLVGLLLWPFVLLLPLVYNIALPIVCALKANEGVEFRCPGVWRLIK